VFLGVLATLTMPVAIVATRYSDSYDLLHAGFAIPIAAALGIASVVMAHHARELDRVTVAGSGGTKTVGVGRFLGILGICMAASATIAVAVYELLVSVQ